MRSGLLDRKVTFHVKSSTRDSFNASVDTYTASFTTFGRIQYAGGDAILSNEEKFYSGTLFLTIRYRSLIVETMRVEVDNVMYRITYIEQLGRREGLKLTLQKLNE